MNILLTSLLAVTAAEDVCSSVIAEEPSFLSFGAKFSSDYEATKEERCSLSKPQRYGLVSFKIARILYEVIEKVLSLGYGPFSIDILLTEIIGGRGYDDRIRGYGYKLGDPVNLAANLDILKKDVKAMNLARFYHFGATKGFAHLNKKVFKFLTSLQNAFGFENGILENVANYVNTLGAVWAKLLDQVAQAGFGLVAAMRLAVQSGTGGDVNSMGPEWAWNGPEYRKKIGSVKLVTHLCEAIQETVNTFTEKFSTYLVLLPIMGKIFDNLLTLDYEKDCAVGTSGVEPRQCYWLWDLLVDGRNRTLDEITRLITQFMQIAVSTLESEDSTSNMLVKTARIITASLPITRLFMYVILSRGATIEPSNKIKYYKEDCLAR